MECIEMLLRRAMSLVAFMEQQRRNYTVLSIRVNFSDMSIHITYRIAQNAIAIHEYMYTQGGALKHASLSLRSV